jgi:ERCC4-type nuclease
VKFSDSTKIHKLKPFRIPDGLVLIVDTREQSPLFTRTKGLTTIRDTLHDGDYSIKGFTDQFAIERKQASDLYSYIGKERKKTVKKLQRLMEFDFAALVVEESFDSLMLQSPYSSISPETVRQFLVSLNIRFGIHFFLSSKRKNLEMYILDRAIKFYKNIHSV